ncbi:MAG: pyridoxal 5'-phosphate synthase glutaminase subunit PdxT [Bacteroidales bacterium]
MKKVGVLSIQGAIEEHAQIIQKLGHTFIPVKTLETLNQVDALILPGGESTAMGRQLLWFHLLEPLRQRILDGMPVFGTCAGMILLSKHIDQSEQANIGLMDTCVVRNAYGSQINSFITELEVKGISHPVPAVFIRAPRISSIGKNIEILSSYENHPVLVREKNMLAASFHPELTEDFSIHRYFIEMI